MQESMLVTVRAPMRGEKNCVSKFTIVPGSKIRSESASDISVLSETR